MKLPKIGKKKFKFYDIRELLNSYPDAQYYMVYGERSNGKTYSSLEYALERAAHNDENFAYIRRLGEDIKPKNISNLFDGHIANGVIENLWDGEWDSIQYRQNRFWLQKHEVLENGEIKLIKSENPIGYAFDISGSEHYKSMSYPLINTIIFDEFLSRTLYLPNEFILFTNLLSTIIRHRSNVKIIMLGNTVNKYCPYFAEMGLKHIKEQKQGSTDIYTYGDSPLTVVVNYTESTKKTGGKDSDVYFAFDNPELKMITHGEWEISIYPHKPCQWKPKDELAQFFILFDNECLHGHIVYVKDGPFIFLHKKTTPIKNEDKDIVYTSFPTHRWNWKMGLTKHGDKLSKFIAKMTVENRIFYGTNEDGEIYRNYLIWSSQQDIRK